MNAKSLLVVAMCFGCRPEAPELVYPEPQPWDPTASDPDFYAPDPFEEGDARLDIGVFYEGGSSEQIAINDTTTHFYVYENTFTVAASDDRVEGYVSDSIEPAGTEWWGGGVHWDQAVDLSAWTTLHFSLKTRDPELTDWALGMNGGGVEARVSLSELGFVADGTWQTFDVSLQSFVDGGADLTSVTVPLVMAGESAPAGTSVLIDDLYFTVGESDDPIDTPDFLGDDPYEEGDQRLSLGVFYEGGASQVREIDGETRHFYIFESTFSLDTTDDRVEGTIADALTTAALPWFGGGVHWDAAEDLSGWDVLHVSLKSSSAGMAAAVVGMTGGDVEGRVPLSDLGFVPDGSWQTFDIPLQVFADAGADLTAVTVPLLLVSEANTAGDTLLIDDLYLTVAED